MKTSFLQVATSLSILLTIPAYGQTNKHEIRATFGMGVDSHVKDRCEQYIENRRDIERDIGMCCGENLDTKHDYMNITKKTCNMAHEKYVPGDKPGYGVCIKKDGK